jgi:hypothetical protein
MRKIAESMGLAVLAGALVSLGCGSSTSTPGGAAGNPGDGGTPDGAGGAGPKDGGDAATGGEDAAQAADGRFGSVPLDQFRDTLATVYCQRILACCTVMNFDQESCANEIKGTTQVTIDTYQPFLDSGKAVYRPEKAAACLDMLDTAACALIKSGTPTLNTATLCADAFESTVAPGGACTDDLDCNAGWCDPTTTRCIARKADGAACEDDGDCLSDNCSTVSMTCRPRTLEGLCPAAP